MVFTILEYVTGISQIAATVLSIFAAFLAIQMFALSRKNSLLKGWRILMIALILFTVEEILGFLQAFGIYQTLHLRHIVPSFIMVALIAALIMQIQIKKGWVK